MTPEQKAAELINKMYYTQSSPTSWVQAKECALIAVNEIIRYTYMGKAKSKNDDNSFEYWQEVKQEIEKL